MNIHSLNPRKASEIASIERVNQGLNISVLQRQMPGARYHAVAEQGIPFKQIAQALGQSLNVPVLSLSPEQSAAHFGWLSQFVGHDMSASSEQTQAILKWQCNGPGLIDDLTETQSY